MAPTFGFPRRMAAISAPASKSAVWMRTVMSASGNRREKRHLVTIADRRIRCSQILVDGDPHRLSGRQFDRPGFAAVAQPGRQACDVLHVAGQFDLFALAAEDL